MERDLTSFYGLKELTAPLIKTYYGGETIHLVRYQGRKYTYDWDITVCNNLFVTWAGKKVDKLRDWLKICPRCFNPQITHSELEELMNSSPDQEELLRDRLRNANARNNDALHELRMQSLHPLENEKKGLTGALKDRFKKKPN